MPNALYAVKVVTRPAETLAGLKVATNMEKSATDCPRLWHEEFGPRMGEFAPVDDPHSYGVSYLTDMASGAFDYWAAMPLAKGEKMPRGMARIELPAGLYAECEVESLEKLAGAYQYIYMEWLPAQKGYEAAADRPSYELYPADFMKTGKLVLYFPVRKI